MSKTLLVVDDEPDICDFVQDVAEGIGFKVVTTSDTSEFPLVYSSKFDGIVMDLSMPGMDGIELIRFLADNRCGSALILMSGFDGGVLATAERLGRERGLHVLGALSKPINIDELEVALGRVPALQAPSKERRSKSESGDGPDEDPLTVEELQAAIRAGDVVPYFQPRVRLEDMQVMGVEALARWRHGNLGVISPAVFIPMAEEHGLIDDLTTAIFDQTLDNLRRWRDAGVAVDASVNFSAKSLGDLNLPDVMARKLDQAGVNPNRVIVEITESSVLSELEDSLDVITRLRMKGFQLSIDDFGTGFSSMQQLQNVPFTELKIDQSFVKRALVDREAQAIVETTIDLGRRLVMAVVAEGVEEMNTLDLLRGSRCEQVQGYFIAKPMPGGEFLDWHADWARAHRN